MTGWNLRSSAASFSIYFLYSSMVVAPISWISPLERDGFRILDASRAPSAPPAPIMVCSSSMNRRIPLLFMTSCTTFLILSSNSPLYLLPATMPDKSRTTTRLSSIFSGTSPHTILCASPSVMAVLPTPGSPIRQGLFLLLLLRIWMIREISFSLPITGSSFPSAAILVRSRLYWSRVGVWLPVDAFIRLPLCRSSLGIILSFPMAFSTSR